jgi:exodeoxyribonuclease VII large subunit
MQHFTLYQLNEFIRRVISLNFTEAVWVQCEILQVNQSRGHYYFQLVQKDGVEDQILARADAVLWQRNYLQLKRALGPLIDELLQDGLEVLLQVKVAFDERYGLQLHIEQIDPAFSLGKLELRRQETVQQLRAEGLLELNAQRPLPSVVQRIALLSSPDAAGLKDFLDQLHNNPFGYRFSVNLFATAVQGQRVEPEMLGRLEQIARQQDRFDCVAIIRGGGSRLDLAAFDQLELCKGVARCPLPVIAGIGHEIDESVLDMTAHTSLKTPTAVAEFFIDHNAAFEAALLQTGARIGQAARWQIKSQNLPLLAQQLHSLARMRLRGERQSLEGNANQIALLDPQRILERGYAFLTREGRGIRSAKDLVAGDKVRIHLSDGQADASIQHINPEP